MNIKYISTVGYDLYSQPCVESGIDSGTIWNGTGALDIGGDWAHSGFGTEQTYAKRSGTNGLDAVGMTHNTNIDFTEVIGWYDATDYDLLVLWVNVVEWQIGVYIDVALHIHQAGWGTSVKLNAYVDITTIGEWQRAVIPLSDFGVSSQMYNILRLTSDGDVSIYLDDIAFAIGSTAYVAVPIENYDVYGTEIGSKVMVGSEKRPSPQVDTQVTPSVDATFPDLRPVIRGRGDLRVFPHPSNL